VGHVIPSTITVTFAEDIIMPGQDQNQEFEKLLEDIGRFSGTLACDLGLLFLIVGLLLYGLVM
jgi:hypothetical protein